MTNQTLSRIHRSTTIPQDVARSKPKESEMFNWMSSRYPHLEFHWNPTRYKIDWVICDQSKPIAWMEAKYRVRYKLTDFSDLVVNLDKWMYGVEVAKKTGIPFSIVQADAVGNYWSFQADVDDIKNGRIFIKRDGRNKHQRDWQDLDVFVHIPKNLWKSLND